MRPITALLILALTLEAVVLNNLRARDPVILHAIVAAHNGGMACNGCAAEKNRSSRERQSIQ